MPRELTMMDEHEMQGCGVMPVRRMTLPIPTEDEEQRVVVQWLQLHGILFAHVPNGGYRRRVEAAIFRGLGVQPGVPDLLIFDPPPAAPDRRGVALELKRRQGGRLTEPQRQWLEALRARGWYATVCRGADEAIETLERLGYGRRSA
ncbi:VRR-NUC domain-containing protein [Thermaerobacter marianensis DSM 12885]|uniref:VRR-NUC domain-containing protein n=1 Tax=Thermaerobacter marianensis (strain ATCC 700841 / DSM 12885 / JCM 10246 / 7p75a) TaxID=644966 RepID=E6SKG9_THEM7|nr:VRR-NUC domain-containing protein [Thermaerobacter marianensis]ADU50156.1 VRR-NUC domain-containing protein [Thermaerobacter marianensis DSM 12885]